MAEAISGEVMAWYTGPERALMLEVVTLLDTEHIKCVLRSAGLSPPATQRTDLF